jgi:adenylate kinase
MDKGELVPDSVVCDIVASRLAEADCQGGALLDGFPRTVAQAEMLYSWLDVQGREIGTVINLQVEGSMLVPRLSGRRTCLGCGATFHVSHNPPKKLGVCDRCSGDVVQRNDDLEETVRLRLYTYERETAPVLAWLKPKGTVYTIDGSKSIAQVQLAILGALGI